MADRNLVHDQCLSILNENTVSLITVKVFSAVLIGKNLSDVQMAKMVN